MEEKINNQKIFRYIPSLIARLILNSSLQDKDIFAENQNYKNQTEDGSVCGIQTKGRSTFLTSLFINPSIYPINHYLPYTIVMNIRLKGFQKLISTLSIKDPNDRKEKLISEYLSIITPKLLLKISKIISTNGGEIIKYNDYEFTTIWNFVPKKNRIQRYEKFYAKQALLSASQIMNEVDNNEITNGIKVKISIGIAMGKTIIGLFGGERKRGEYIVMGEAIQKAEMCINYCLSHEILIGNEINELFVGSEEIVTKEVDNEENLNLHLITKFNEEALKNFKGFKIKMKYDKLNMTKTVYENLAKKVYIFSSILPQGLVKYLDVDQDQNLKEISVVTIATIRILFYRNLMDNLKKVQNVILDIQKATYLTFGSLLYISKTYNGLLVRCAWGMDPGSFIDDTARCIAACKLIGYLTNYFDMRLAIGIATGSCYTGLIPLQGDRKQFTILGKKVNLSRTLADEAFQKILNAGSYRSKRKYAIYCDKKTVEQSQKWFRFLKISEIKIYFNKQSQELYYETKEEFNFKENPDLKKNNDNEKEQNEAENNISKQNSYRAKDKVNRTNTSILGEYNRKSTENFKKKNINNSILDNTNVISIEIFGIADEEEYFLQNPYDPFPMIRTHKHNSFSPKIKQYFYNHFQNTYFENKMQINLVGNLPIINISTPNEEEKINNKLQKSLVIYGYDNEINKLVNIMNTVTQKSKKQFLLVKGPLGVGKSLFIRKALFKYLDENDELRDIYYNQNDFIICGIVDPLTATFPYNTFCFILRKIFLYLKKLNKINEIIKICEDLNLDDENIKSINLVLSNGKKDINIKEENKPINRREGYRLRNNSIIKNNVSIVNELEGPHKIKDSNKIDNFFFEMIKLYKKFLNSKFNEPAKAKSSSSKSKIKNKVPLILVVDDVQMSDKYSIDFIRYIFNNDDKKNNPFMVILVERTPFNKNYRPILHRELEFFLSAFSDIEDNEAIGNDKIILFNIKPIMDKDILKTILIENFNNSVTKKYSHITRIESIDNKILNFLLTKTFLGIPLLVIELFDTLMKSQKFMTISNNEFKITQELIDDNDAFDWSNILLPYVYEKITSMTINSLISFKEILILKYACTIGTIFDVQTLDKINPMNLIIKKEDLYNIMEKLANEYIIEIFENESMNRRTKKYVICKVCFPLMREVLYKKFPIERRAILHAETAKLLSGGKKVYYFNSKVEGNILKRHLLYSEINVVQEIESKTQDTKLDYLNTKIMNTNNLTILFVKDICSRIFDRNKRNILEGNLEMLVGNKWMKINYYVDKVWKIYINKIKTNKNEKDLQYIIPIKDIFKNVILQNNCLEITIAEYSPYLLNKNKKRIVFHSDSWKDIFNLDTALTFLRMIANYEKYIYNFGYTQLPLYKKGWYARKEKKYYANLDQSHLLYYNDFRQYRTKRFLSCYGLLNQTDKLISDSKDLNRPFSIIMRVALSLFLANVQINLTKEKSDLIDEYDEYKLIKGKIIYSIYISTPQHVKSPVQKVIEELEKKQKEEEELLRMRFKGKFSLFPISLLKRERRVFGSGVIQSKRNQSIMMFKSDVLCKNKIEETDENRMHAKSTKFNGRKGGKSKTIVDRTEEVPKEVSNKVKSQTALKFMDINYSSESKISSSEESKSESDESEEKSENKLNFNQSESSSDFNENDNEKESNNEVEEKKEKLNNNIKYINIYSPKKNENINNKKEENEKNNENKEISINNKSNDNQNKIVENNNKNNYVNDNKNKNNIIHINNFNINNNKNQTNINTKNNYNINNYINNNININLINNHYLNPTLNYSFNNKKLLNNYYEPKYNININSLRMSQRLENELHITLMQKVKPKKSYSAELKSIKEKYRNNSNEYLNLNRKFTFDVYDDESITSDKDSESNIDNVYLVTSPQMNNSKKKNSKLISEITPTKEDIFSRAIIAFLGDENTEMATPNKDDIYRKNRFNSSKRCNKNVDNIIKNNITNNSEEPKGENENKNKPKKRIKRSSLLTTMKVQIKNKSKHVTFIQEKEKINQPKPEEALHKCHSFSEKNGIIDDNNDKDKIFLNK